MLTFAVPAQAAEWRVEPYIGVEESYSTNIGGDADDEEGGFVTDVSPGISIRGTGRRLKLYADYSPSILFYHSDSDRNRTDHTLSGNGSLEAIENFFFIDARANISQQFLSPTGARPTSNTSDTNNRYEASSYSISPYIRGYLFGDNQYMVRNENIWSDTGSVSGTTEELTGIYTNRTTARFDTPIPVYGFSLEYDKRHTEEDGAEDIDTQIGRAIFHYRIEQNLVLSARVGYEDDDYGDVQREGDVWGVGLKWNPTPRTSVDGYWEDHYYGSSYFARVEHRRPRSAFQVLASRGIQTFDGNLNSSSGMTNSELASLILSDPRYGFNPAQIRALVPALASTWGNPNAIAPGNLFTNQAQLVQRFEAVAMTIGVRNTAALKLFMSKTEDIAGQGFSVPIPGFGSSLDTPELVTAETVEDRGIQLSLSHKLTTLSSLTASATRTYTDTENDEDSIETTQDDFDLRLTRKLGPKTNGFAGARYSIFNSDFGDSDYNETEIFAGFHHRF